MNFSLSPWSFWFEYRTSWAYFYVLCFYSFQFPRTRPATRSYTEVVSDFSDTTTSSLDQERAGDVETEEEVAEVELNGSDGSEEEDLDFDPASHSTADDAMKTAYRRTTRSQSRTGNVSLSINFIVILLLTGAWFPVLSIREGKS